MTRTPAPGVSRNERLSAEGLERLAAQLQAGINPSAVVLAQWIRRYGDAARELIRAHGQYCDEFDLIE